jgi:hypothetical protein
MAHSLGRFVRDGNAKLAYYRRVMAGDQAAIILVNFGKGSGV